MGLKYIFEISVSGTQISLDVGLTYSTFRSTTFNTLVFLFTITMHTRRYILKLHYEASIVLLTQCRNLKTRE